MFNSTEFADVVSILESGPWIWIDGDCSDSYRTFRFNLDERTVDLNLTEPSSSGADTTVVYTYELFWATPTGFRGRIIGEERLKKDGTPVEWDLILSDKYTYAWRRSDWLYFMKTKDNIRCR